MNRIVTVVFYFLAADLLLLFALDWIVWGRYTPRTDGLGLWGDLGIVVILCLPAFLLEYIPSLLKIRR